MVCMIPNIYHSKCSVIYIFIETQIIHDSKYMNCSVISPNWDNGNDTNPRCHGNYLALGNIIVTYSSSPVSVTQQLQQLHFLSMFMFQTRGQPNHKSCMEFTRVSTFYDKKNRNMYAYAPQLAKYF